MKEGKEPQISMEKETMFRQKQVLLISVFFILSSFLFVSQDAFSQETWREKIRQRWKERRNNRNQPVEIIPGKDYNFSLQHDGLQRRYHVHLPPNYNENSSTPVVIYLHGMGGNMKAAFMDGMDKMSDKHGFILAVPEGTGEVKLGHVRGSWNGGKWATGKCCGNANDVGFISMMIDEIKSNFNVDAQKIYATGISNGGLMTNRLGCELSDKIAAIATVAPAGVMLNCHPTPSISVMDIHGTGDRCNNFDGRPAANLCANSDYQRTSPKDLIADWLKINQCQEISKQTYENGAASCMSYDHCKSDAEVVFCKVKGMGHTWPGGAQYLSEKLIGPVSHDISFDQVWEFFKRHPKK